MRKRKTVGTFVVLAFAGIVTTMSHLPFNNVCEAIFDSIKAYMFVYKINVFLKRHVLETYHAILNSVFPNCRSVKVGFIIKFHNIEITSPTAILIIMRYISMGHSRITNTTMRAFTRMTNTKINTYFIQKRRNNLFM